MLFVQFRFFVFFLIVFCVHWALRTNTSRKVWLLLCSHFFYACLFLAGPDSVSAETFPPLDLLRNFVIWGGLNGLALTFHRYWQDLTTDWGPGLKNVMDWLAVPITFYTFLVTLVFVRARDVIHEGSGTVILSGTRGAADALRAICLFKVTGKDTFTNHCLWLFVVIAVIHYANYRGWLANWWRRIPYWAFAALIGIGFASALVFVPARYKPFIYFQF